MCVLVRAPSCVFVHACTSVCACVREGARARVCVCGRVGFGVVSLLQGSRCSSFKSSRGCRGSRSLSMSTWGTHTHVCTRTYKTTLALASARAQFRAQSQKALCVHMNAHACIATQLWPTAARLPSSCPRCTGSSQTRRAGCTAPHRRSPSRAPHPRPRKAAPSIRVPASVPVQPQLRIANHHAWCAPHALRCTLSAACHCGSCSSPTAGSTSCRPRTRTPAAARR